MASLLFRARFEDDDALVYVLFEHQSTEDRSTRRAPGTATVAARDRSRELVNAPEVLDDLRPRLRFVLDDLGALSDARRVAVEPVGSAPLDLSLVRRNGSISRR